MPSIKLRLVHIIFAQCRLDNTIQEFDTLTMYGKLSMIDGQPCTWKHQKTTLFISILNTFASLKNLLITMADDGNHFPGIFSLC